jgi:NitT/TauT family transport system substrate-binding protein
MDKAGAHLLGWVGDETPWQIGAVFVTTKTADERGEMVKRFLRVLAKGSHDYHDAFTDKNEERADQPSAAAALAIMAKSIGSTPQELDDQLPYVDPTLRLDIRDVKRQIDWYRDQGMVKGDISVDKLVDKRYAVPLR